MKHMIPEDLNVTSSTVRPLNGGTHPKVKFPNGYGASVVLSDISYGSEDGLYELAVLGQDGHLTYATAITNDVLGWLTEGDVRTALARVAELSS